MTGHLIGLVGREGQPWVVNRSGQQGAGGGNGQSLLLFGQLIVFVLVHHSHRLTCVMSTSCEIAGVQQNTGRAVRAMPAPRCQGLPCSRLPHPV